MSFLTYYLENGLCFSENYCSTAKHRNNGTLVTYFLLLLHSPLFKHPRITVAPLGTQLSKKSMFIWWPFPVFLSIKAKVIVFVPVYDFTFAYLKMHWECLCPCDLDYSTSVNSTFSVICFFPSLHISCNEFLFFFQKCDVGGDRNWSYGISLKTQFMSGYYVSLLVQCWAVSCLEAFLDGNYTARLAFSWPSQGTSGADIRVPSSDNLNMLHWHYLLLSAGLVMPSKKSAKPVAMIQSKHT